MKTSLTPLVVVALGLLHLVQLMPITDAPARVEENFLSEVVKDGFLLESPPSADATHATEAAEAAAPQNASAQLFAEEEEEESGSGTESGSGISFDKPSTTPMTTAAATTDKTVSPVSTTTEVSLVEDKMNGDGWILFHTTTTEPPSTTSDLTTTTTTTTEPPSTTTEVSLVEDKMNEDGWILFHTTTTEPPSTTSDLTTTTTITATTEPPSTTTEVSLVEDKMNGDGGILFHTTTTEPSTTTTTEPSTTTTTELPSTTTQVGSVADLTTGHQGRIFQSSSASDVITTTTTAAPVDEEVHPKEERISSRTLIMKEDVSQLKVNPTPSKQGGQARGSGWMIIVGFVVGVAALVLICIAIATKDSWNGPSQATIEAERNGRSNVQPEKQEMEEFLPTEERRESEYTVVPLSELSES